MLKDFSVQSLFMGVLAAFAGFASSFAVVLHGLQAVGATEAQAASGLMALSLGLGICAIVLSFTTRLPVSMAWSTPGAALTALTFFKRFQLARSYRRNRAPVQGNVVARGTWLGLPESGLAIAPSRVSDPRRSA